jgi:hypothetical protein
MSNDSRTLGEFFISRDRRPDLDIDFEKPVASLTPDELAALHDATFRGPKWKEVARETPEARKEFKLFKDFVAKRVQDVKTTGREVPESKIDELVREFWGNDVSSPKVEATPMEALVKDLARRLGNLEQMVR